MKFLLLAACAIALSCKKQIGSDCVHPAGDHSITLNGCTEKEAVADGTLCLLQVNDSRCPLNSQCVWAGVGIAKFSFKAAGVEHPLSLSTSRPSQINGLPPNDTTIAGYKLQLVDIKPYPGAPAEPVRAIVRITR